MALQYFNLITFKNNICTPQKNVTEIRYEADVTADDQM